MSLAAYRRQLLSEPFIELPEADARGRTRPATDEELSRARIDYQTGPKRQCTHPILQDTRGYLYTERRCAVCDHLLRII